MVNVSLRLIIVLHKPQDFSVDYHFKTIVVSVSFKQFHLRLNVPYINENILGFPFQILLELIRSELKMWEILPG